MRPITSRLLAASLALGALGAGTFVFSSLTATSGPFGGSEPAVCGVNMSCSSSTFTATSATGPSFVCNANVTTCVDLGTGDNDGITSDGTNIIIGTGAGTAAVYIGGSGNVVFSENGSATFTNGAVSLNGTAYIQNASGSSPVNVTDPHGLMVNSTTPLKGLIMAPVTIDVGSIAATTCTTTAATVAGVEASDYVFATPNFDLSGTAPNVIVGNCRVTNAGTDEVTCLWCNAGGAGNEDPASGSYLFLVMRP